MFRIELIWNREFNWCNYSTPKNTLELAIAAAKDIRDSGDGARVKKIRVLDENDKVMWNG